jgi:hypothetical protein
MLLSISWLTLILRIFFTHIDFVHFVIHVDFANFIIMVVGNLWNFFLGSLHNSLLFAKKFQAFEIVEGIET